MKKKVSFRHLCNSAWYRLAIRKTLIQKGTTRKVKADVYSNFMSCNEIILY
jgi:hypothetical protein